MLRTITGFKDTDEAKLVTAAIANRQAGAALFTAAPSQKANFAPKAPQL